MVHGIYVATLVTSSLAMEGVCEQRGYLIQLAIGTTCTYVVSV